MQTDDQIFTILQQQLRACHGEANALTLQRLAEIACCPRRRVEIILEERIVDLGFVVVSGSPGYWRPTSADEINHYRASLRSRIFKLWKRSKSVGQLASQCGFVRTGKSFANPPAVQGELF
jgi:hypothetical protein